KSGEDNGNRKYDGGNIVFHMCSLNWIPKYIGSTR
ncbi:MAG: hypothetical protein ACI84C_002936, partial [Flavobacteriales bacterium]